MERMVGSILGLDNFLRERFKKEISKQFPSTLKKKSLHKTQQIPQPPHANFNKYPGMK